MTCGSGPFAHWVLRVVRLTLKFSLPDQNGLLLTIRNRLRSADWLIYWDGVEVGFFAQMLDADRLAEYVQVKPSNQNKLWSIA